MKAQLTTHAKEAHMDMMKDSTQEDIAKWNKNFDESIWPNAPEK